MKNKVFITFICLFAANLLYSQITEKANWIWYPGRHQTVNYSCFARRQFDVKGPVSKALLHISVFTDYILYVNGSFIGRGPTPSDPAFQSFDTYDVKEYLKPGANSIAVACHNYGVGVHWQYAGPGGLICLLEMDTPSGSEVITTDSSWKMKEADCWDLRSPRFFWSCGFAETFYSSLYDPKWKETDYNDAQWNAPQLLGHPPVRPWQRLLPREIPFLRETRQEPIGLEKGTFKLEGVHAVHFDSLIAKGTNELGYAQTSFYSEQDRELILKVESDDAYKCFLNGQLALEQNYLDSEVRTKLWRGYDEYEQVHWGTTLGWTTSQRIKLHKGWNPFLVVVDQGPYGWGFCLSFSDPATDQLVDLPFATDQKSNRKWLLAGPFVSTGMNNSLDEVASDISSVASGKPVFCDPFQYGEITDYSMLMHNEQRVKPKVLPPSSPLELRQGEYGIFDFGQVKVGFPEFQVEAEKGTILDVGYSQVFFEDRHIRFSNGGAMKNVDRLYLAPGKQSWEPFERRTGRFVHLSCRSGKVKISNTGFRLLGYPVKEVASFQCSDTMLNRIWEVSRYTSELLMQYGFQDCLKREQGTLNTNQAFYQYLAAAYCFGDHLLIRKCMNTSLRTQQDDGWFHAHGPSSPNQDEVTLDFYWLLLLREYYLNSGDLEYIRDVFPNTEDMLRCFSKWTNLRGLIDGRNFVVARPGQLIYLDDTQSKGNYLGLFSGETVGFNILYQDALGAAADLAEALGLKDRSGFYRNKSEWVKQSCRQRFWDTSKGMFADWRLNDEWAKTHHAIFQIASLYHDLADSTERISLLNYVTRDLSPQNMDKPQYPLQTFGYYYYLLEVLFKNGYDDMAYDLMRTYYGSWIKAGGTTFGEHYKLSFLNGGPINFEYEVHGYGTSAHPHFYTNILGVRPQTAGFKDVLLAPHPGSLAWAKGVVSTPQGNVEVSWKQEGSTFQLDAKLPAQCGYNLQLPKLFKTYEVTINGKKVGWKNELN